MKVNKITKKKIFPGKKLQKELKLYAKNRSIITLDKTKIPKMFLNLIPYAEKWGIGDDIIRYDFEIKTSGKEKIKLKKVLKGKIKKINKWLDTFKSKKMSNEAIAFLYMILAAEEMGIYPKEGHHYKK